MIITTSTSDKETEIETETETKPKVEIRRQMKRWRGPCMERVYQLQVSS